MVSTFLSSLTDLLQDGSPEAKSVERKPVQKKKSKGGRSKERRSEINQNVVQSSNSTPSPSGKISESKRSKPKVNPTKSNAGLQYLNAESLDRAIVHRLQSKVSFNSPGTSKDLKNKDLSSGSRRSSSMGRDNNNSRHQNLVKPSSSQNSLVDNSGFSRDATLFPEVHASGSRSDSASSQTDLTEGLGTRNDYKTYLEQLSSTGYSSNSGGAENRSIVYKNAQFCLDNSSKEALIPGVRHEESDITTRLLGLEDFSIFRRPTAAADVLGQGSRKTLIGTESVLGNTVPAASPIRRRNSPSSSNSPIRNPLFAPSYSGGSTKIGEELFETAMNKIIERGGDEFKNKYSSWVWEAFRSHLIQLKSLLLDEFNQKMKETLDEREQEVITLQKQYRDKLAEFDTTTDGFQKMIDTLYQENQRVLKAKDFVIEKLKKEFMECKRHFEHDLIRQMQAYRKEAEMEKLELQKRNDELMMIMLTDASKCGLEEAFKREIESLHKMIKALTTQNDVLHQQLEEATNSANLINKKNIEAYQMQLEMNLKDMSDLKKRLQQVEREKEDLAVTHNEEIAKLNRRIQETSTRYDHQLRDAADEMESLRKKFQKETKELKQKLQNQDNQHAQLLNQVKQQYGSQVETLSKAVAQLKSELTMNNSGSKRFSPSP